MGGVGEGRRSIYYRGGNRVLLVEGIGVSVKSNTR